jgi:hypothetical protein
MATTERRRNRGTPNRAFGAPERHPPAPGGDWTHRCCVFSTIA